MAYISNLIIFIYQFLFPKKCLYFLDKAFILLVFIGVIASLALFILKLQSLFLMYLC